MGRRLLSFILSLSMASQAFSAVAFDAEGVGFDNNTPPTSSVNFSTLTIGTGSNRALVVQLATIGTTVVNSVTWDPSGANQALTLIGSKADGSSDHTVYLYGLVNPVSGNKTLNVTLASSQELIMQAVSFTGVSQSGGTGSFTNVVSSTGSAASGSVTVTSASGDMPIFLIALGNAQSISTVNQTQTFLVHGAGSIEAAGSYAIGANSVIFTGTFSGTDVWTAIGCDILSIFPSVTTQIPTSITSTTATGNGTSLSSGGASLTDEGICIGSSSNPQSSCTSSGSTSVGTFTSSLTGLTSNTLYYVNAYATNANGTTYANDGVFFGTVANTGIQTSSGSGSITAATGTGSVSYQ